MSRFLSPGVYTTEKDLSFRRSLASIRRIPQTTSGQITPPPQPPQTVWILSFGFWNDNGFWFDNQQWND
jgi:hypothetical protein